MGRRLKLSKSRIIANGMLRENTPIEDWTAEWGLFVKREDLSCPKPGPPFSKTRGVYKHVLSREESTVGVLDTYHSQAGHAVARACQILGKTCVNYYPVYKSDIGQPLRLPQQRSKELGAELVGLPAGRSCILYHAAKKDITARGGYMMPNALKLDESVEETAREVPDLWFDCVVIPASSGTIAAGVIRGFDRVCREQGSKSRPIYLIHLGYSRSHDQVLKYLKDKSGVDADVELIDERYSYKDQAKPGPTPDWPCNPYYDLKAFRWWLTDRRYSKFRTLFWNVG